MTCPGGASRLGRANAVIHQSSYRHFIEVRLGEDAARHHGSVIRRSLANVPDGEATMLTRTWQGLCVASVMLSATTAFAVEPVGGDKFNVSTQIDLFKLDRSHFMDVVTPVAKTENG